MFALHEDKEEKEWAALEQYGRVAVKSLSTALEVISQDLCRTAWVSLISVV